MAIIRIGLFDDHVVGAVRVEVASSSAPVMARAADELRHGTPKGAVMKAAHEALTQRRMPGCLEIAQLTALVTRVDAASSYRVLELAREVGIGRVGPFACERSPLIAPVGSVRPLADVIQTSVHTDLWRMLG